jgi:hypothetical protein
MTKISDFRTTRRVERAGGFYPVPSWLSSCGERAGAFSAALPVAADTNPTRTHSEPNPGCLCPPATNGRAVTEPTVPDAPDTPDERGGEQPPANAPDTERDGESDEPLLDGPYRVLESTRDRAEWLFIDPAGDPTYVPHEGHGALDERVRGLRSGYRVDAAFDWTGDDPRLESLEVLEPSLFAFVPHADPVFEAAQSCWETARREGQAMNSRVTHTTDGDPAGVVYVFADQPGQRDLFEEFRDGVKPLDPLVDRLAKGEEPPFEAFVLAPDDPYVVVYLVVEKGGMVADTVRDTYDLSRPDEPLADEGDAERRGDTDGNAPDDPASDGSAPGTMDAPDGAAGDTDAPADPDDTGDAEFDLGDAVDDLPGEDG